jgi:hypothetical protein
VEATNNTFHNEIINFVTNNGNQPATTRHHSNYISCCEKGYKSCYHRGAHKASHNYNGAHYFWRENKE